MKKQIAAIMAVVMFSFLMNITAFAAQATDNVWLSVSLADVDELRVSVVSDGTASDGQLEIAYDTAALSCTEDDVTLSGDVDMYSVNVENGTIKIAYLGIEPLPEGSFIEIDFEQAGESEDDAKDALTKLTMQGAAYGPEGETANVKEGPVVEQASSEEPTSEEPSGEEGTTEGSAEPSSEEVSGETKNPGGDSLNTGDTTHFPTVLLAGSIAVLLTVGFIRKNKEEGGQA